MRMSFLGVLLACILFPSHAIGKRKPKYPSKVEALSWIAVPVTHASEWTVPGSEKTQCYGTGSNLYSWQSLDLDCKTVTTPPVTYTFSHTNYRIYNRLRSQDEQGNWWEWIVGCWETSFSTHCARLEPHHTFPASIGHNKIKLIAHPENRDGTVKLDRHGRPKKVLDIFEIIKMTSVSKPQ